MDTNRKSPSFGLMILIVAETKNLSSLSEKANDSFGNTLIGTIGSPETLSTLLISASNVLTNPVKGMPVSGSEGPI